MTKKKIDTRLWVGWREWVALPDLGIEAIKAKVDTGARTSTLHAFSVERFFEAGGQYVRFGIHPIQKRSDIVIYREAPVLDERFVSDSGGHKEKRIVIETTLQMGLINWPIEVTLTDRDTMQFRMLIGRTAMTGRLLVDASASYLTGKPDEEILIKHLRKT